MIITSPASKRRTARCKTRHARADLRLMVVPSRASPTSGAVSPQFPPHNYSQVGYRFLHLAILPFRMTTTAKSSIVLVCILSRKSGSGDIPKKYHCAHYNHGGKHVHFSLFNVPNPTCQLLCSCLRHLIIEPSRCSLKYHCYCRYHQRPPHYCQAGMLLPASILQDT